MKKRIKLIPHDKKQCQAEKPNGNSFMTLGGVPGLSRCKNKPVVIIVEKRKPKGSMSLCKECWTVAIQQLGEKTFNVKPITVL